MTLGRIPPARTPIIEQRFHTFERPWYNWFNEAFNAITDLQSDVSDLEDETITDFLDSIYNVKDYGATGDGVTNDTDAIASALSAAGRNPVFFPSGTYLTETITDVDRGKTLFGAGQRRTILKSYSGEDVIEVTGKSLHTFTIKGMGIQGNGGSGNGIYIHDNLQSPWLLLLEDLHIRDCGGRGIYITDHFRTTFRRIRFDNNAGTQCEVEGANACLFEGLYFGTVPDNQIGLWVWKAECTLISCTGVDSDSGSGVTWARFGSDSGDPDGLQYCRANLYSCNIEDFTSVGIEIRSNLSVLNIVGTAFIAPSTGTVTGVSCFKNMQIQGVFGPGSRFGTKGASYANGSAVHTQGTAAPFISLGNNGPSNFYDDANGNTENIPNLVISRFAFKEHAWSLRSIEVSKALYFNDAVLRGTVNTFSDGDISPDVSGGRIFKTSNSSPTTISAFNGEVTGQEIIVIFGDGNTTVDFTGTELKGNGGVDWSPSSGDHMTCVYDGSNWYCDVSDNTP